MAKILYIDDEPFHHILLRRLICRGFECIRITDGNEAIKSTCAEHPDLILIGIYNLPNRIGWDIAKKLKTTADTKDVSIIGLITHPVSRDIEKKLTIGCDDYDTYPIKLPRLLEKIDRLLPHY